MNLLTVTVLAALNWYYIPGDGSYRQLDDTTSIPGKLRGVVTNEAAAVAWQAEQDALAAAQAAAAASNAAVQAAMPAQFPTGVAVPVPDANGHFMLLQPQDDGAVVAIQISDSPINPATWAARKAAAIATNTVVTSTYRQTLRDIKSNLATNKVEIQAIDPTDSSAAGQKAQIQALKRELIDLLVEVQNLRQALARKEREE